MFSKIQLSDAPRINYCISNRCTKIPTPPPPPPFTTIPTIPYLSPRCYSNPTTFLQTDPSTFKPVVQMFTGLSETTTTKTEQPPPQPPQQHYHLLALPPPPIRNFNIPPQKQGFKLYQRRNNRFRNGLMINPLMPSYAHNYYGFSPRKKLEIVSPSMFDFPSLALSPVTPLLNDNPFENFSPSLGNFYHHSPSTTVTERDSKPKLLPLFPTSPRVSESSSS